jgi:hypothetical protein
MGKKAKGERELIPPLHSGEFCDILICGSKRGKAGVTNVAQLILTLIRTNRQATTEELQQIITTAAQAPFSSRPLKITRWLRQALEARGLRVPSEKLPSVEIHLLKRMHLDRQWPLGTTRDQFIADLHHAVQHPNVQVWTYRWLGEAFVGFLAPSHIQNVSNSEAYIFVAYSADYGVIKTGFQASSLEAIFTETFENLTQHR